MDLSRIPVGPEPPGYVYAVVEIPKGSRNKYEYDPKLGAFRLDRVLYASVHYPTAYGFIPQTQSDDGDPIDILVLTSEPTFPGCLVISRPVGLLRMQDEHGQDEKILAVSDRDPHFIACQDLDDVSEHLLTEIEHFFSSYKSLEGKSVETFGWEGKRRAQRLIQEAMTN